MFGDNLKKARKHKGMTQKELAKQLGISDNGISNWEKGVSRPDIDQVARLCSILGINPNELITSDIVQDVITPAEKNLIKKYNQLDLYGKKAIETLLNIEYERCVSEQFKTQIKFAARNGEFTTLEVTDSEKKKLLDEINQMSDVED